MTCGKLLNIFYFLLITFSVDSKLGVNFSLSDAALRHARSKCLQRFPQADILTYSYANTSATHCFLHCFLYETGLMDLTTRGLDGSKFYDILEQNEEAFTNDTCLETFDFSESLSGKCSDTYRKLMEFRVTCWELFAYIFTTNKTFQLSPSNSSKKVGQSATEFCDALEKNSSDDSKNEDITLLAQYKNYLICVFENIYYLDAYGRINEYEINLSYQEAQLESDKSKALVKTCSHRANSKYQSDYYGNVVFEMQKCLKSHSTFFKSVFRLRDEISRKY